MKRIESIYLSNKLNTTLLALFFDNESGIFEIKDKDIADKLREKNIIDVVSIHSQTFKFTALGREYCELLIEKKEKERGDNIIKWGTFIISILALVLSIVSLMIQFKDHETNVNKSEIRDTIIETSETITTSETGILCSQK